MLLVHHAEDPKTIALNLLDKVPVKSEDLEGWEVLEFAGLFQVGDIVTM